MSVTRERIHESSCRKYCIYKRMLSEPRQVHYEVCTNDEAHQFVKRPYEFDNLNAAKERMNELASN